MAERPDLPKIKPEGQPSLINHEMGVGAFWGNIGGSLAAMAAPAKYKIATVIGGSALGGLLGGMQGKNKQEQEQNQGAVVKTPGYWNKGIVSGMMAGWAVGLPIRHFAKGAKGLVFVAEFGGAIVGSVLRKNELQRDFDRAVTVRDLETEGLRNQLRAAQLANGTLPSYMNSVEAHESAALAMRQERKQTHADKASIENLAEAAR